MVFDSLLNSGNTEDECPTKSESTEINYPPHSHRTKVNSSTEKQKHRNQLLTQQLKRGT